MSDAVTESQNRKIENAALSRTPARALPQTVIPAQAAVFVIPAKAGIQGSLRKR